MENCFHRIGKIANRKEFENNQTQKYKSNLFVIRKTINAQNNYQTDGVDGKQNQIQLRVNPKSNTQKMHHQKRAKTQKKIAEKI